MKKNNKAKTLLAAALAMSIAAATEANALTAAQTHDAHSIFGISEAPSSMLLNNHHDGDDHKCGEDHDGDGNDDGHKCGDDGHSCGH